MKHINYMKRMNRLLLMTLPLVLSLPLQAQIKNSPSGLNSREFSKYWKIESESPDFRKIFSKRDYTLAYRKDGRQCHHRIRCLYCEENGDR